MKTTSTFSSAAYGGSGWQPRVQSHQEEIGAIWEKCGINNEWANLKAVVLHLPGQELAASLSDPDQVQMLEPLEIDLAQQEHQQLASAYTAAGVTVHYVEPAGIPQPNQMFCADLFAMTPEGAILARPASTVRAGEEREVAACLARNGIPILRTLTGSATFEGADLIWLNPEQVLLGQGLRTNNAAAIQISSVLADSGVTVSPVDMPFGTMHLMGMLRIVDRDLALAWPRRTPHSAVVKLRDAGYSVAFVPEHEEFEHQRAFNFVTLGPRKILMVAGNQFAKEFYTSLGIECYETPATELSKATGAVGCLTGIVHRE